MRSFYLKSEIIDLKHEFIGIKSEMVMDFNGRFQDFDFVRWIENRDQKGLGLKKRENKGKREDISNVEIERNEKWFSEGFGLYGSVFQSLHHIFLFTGLLKLLFYSVGFTQKSPHRRGFSPKIPFF